YPLVSADRASAFRRPHNGRNPRETNQRLTVGTTQGTGCARPGNHVAKIDARAGSEGQTANRTRVTFRRSQLLCSSPSRALEAHANHTRWRSSDAHHRGHCAWELVAPTHPTLNCNRTIDRSTTIRKSEQRQGERVFCRRNTRRNPDTLIQDR